MSRAAQADAREQVDRAVLAPQVAPADLEEPARRHLEPLLGLPALARRAQARAALDAAAVADRRRRRFLDLHEHVAPRLAGVAQLLDADAAEQPERGQPLLALDARRVAERLARPQQQLALDRLGARPLVADDDHVVDDDLRPFADREADVGAGVVLGERRRRDRRRRSRSRGCGTRGRCGRDRTPPRPPRTAAPGAVVISARSCASVKTVLPSNATLPTTRPRSFGDVRRVTSTRRSSAGPAFSLPGSCARSRPGPPRG